MGIFKAFTFLQGLACPNLVDIARTDSESILPLKGGWLQTVVIIF